MLQLYFPFFYLDILQKTHSRFLKKRQFQTSVLAGLNSVLENF